ncbi:MAG TPA: hypothetical protein VLG37_01550 [Candidatus Saccharimonadales bacterium]|nr:hypothetical protein [Candidatus Saccharimonadales bacterium]
MNRLDSGQANFRSLREFVDIYHTLGTHVATPEDVPIIRQLLGGLEASGVSLIKYRYLGWLNYELGIALQAEQPDQAGRHFAKATTNLRRDSATNPRESVIFGAPREIALIELLHARLGATERQHRLRQRTVVKQMGELVIKNMAALKQGKARKLTPLLNRTLRGEASEAAMAGTLLTIGLPDSTLVPAPASPRQNSPHNSPISRAMLIPGTLPGSSKKHAIDYSLYNYKDTESVPALVTPLQVKTVLTDEEESAYDESVAILYSDRDLFISTNGEFCSLGQALIDWANTGAASRQLALAQGNVTYALEDHGDHLAHLDGS